MRINHIRLYGNTNISILQLPFGTSSRKFRFFIFSGTQGKFPGANVKKKTSAKHVRNMIKTYSHVT